MKRNTKHIRYYHHHIGFSYPVSLRQRLYSMVLVPLIVLAVVFLILETQHFLPKIPFQVVTWSTLVWALLATFGRLLVAYVFALIIAIPLALMINYNATAERFLLPLFDIMQSVPVLAFFPVIIIVFIHYHLFNGAAVFILLVTMMWSIVFNVVSGLRTIHSDIKDAAIVFRVRGLAYVRKILLPAVVPYFVTGSLLGWAGGWNIIIVAEVLHTYIPGANASVDLFGIGSILVGASASGQQHLFLSAILVMIIGVGLLNFFVWQKLLRYAEKYKFE